MFSTRKVILQTRETKCSADSAHVVVLFGWKSLIIIYVTWLLIILLDCPQVFHSATRIFTKAWCLYNAVDSCNIWVLGVTLMLAWQAVTWAARALCTWQKSLMLVEEEPPTFLWSQICSSVDIGGHEQISSYNLSTWRRSNDGNILARSPWLMMKKSATFQAWMLMEDLVSTQFLHAK